MDAKRNRSCDNCSRETTSRGICWRCSRRYYSDYDPELAYLYDVADSLYGEDFNRDRDEDVRRDVWQAVNDLLE